MLFLNASRQLCKIYRQSTNKNRLRINGSGVTLSKMLQILNIQNKEKLLSRNVRASVARDVTRVDVFPTNQATPNSTSANYATVHLHYLSRPILSLFLSLCFSLALCSACLDRETDEIGFLSSSKERSAIFNDGELSTDSDGLQYRFNLFYFGQNC